MARTVEVPKGCKCVFVADEIVAEFADWSPIDGHEAMALPLADDPLVVEVWIRKHEVKP